MGRTALPERFLWGTATAAHQIEGGNDNSDCWALERATPSLFAEPSGAAADGWARFAQDLDLVAALGLNAYRFSIEWARIEPEPGVFSAAALDHYQQVLDACAERNLTAVVTFHHFTQPLWMAGLGGLGSPQFAARFAAYCDRAARRLDGIGLACTLNELNLPVTAGAYFRDRAPPDARTAAERALGAPLTSFFLFATEDAVMTQGLAAHCAASAAIKAARPATPVGLTLAIHEETAEPGAEAVRDARREAYAPFLDAVAGDDFLGVQNYTRYQARTDGGAGPAVGAPRTTMGWEDRPQAVGQVCRWIASRWDLPLVVTENGYPGHDDARRAAFIDEAVDGVLSAKAAGADVRGYFYWSLLDNFEWMLGFRQRFGLVSVDADHARHVKASARSLTRWATSEGRRAGTPR